MTFWEYLFPSWKGTNPSSALDLCSNVQQNSSWFKMLTCWFLTGARGDKVCNHDSFSSPRWVARLQRRNTSIDGNKDLDKGRPPEYVYVPLDTSLPWTDLKELLRSKGWHGRTRKKSVWVCLFFVSYWLFLTYSDAISTFVWLYVMNIILSPKNSSFTSRHDELTRYNWYQSVERTRARQRKKQCSTNFSAI